MGGRCETCKNNVLCGTIDFVFPARLPSLPSFVLILQQRKLLNLSFRGAESMSLYSSSSFFASSGAPHQMLVSSSPPHVSIKRPLFGEGSSQRQSVALYAHIFAGCW